MAGTAASGRRAKPPALKLLSGRAPGRDSGGRRVDPPPAFVRAAPDLPAGLGREAKDEWLRIVPELDRLRLLKRPSLSSLVSHCQTWSTFVKASRDIQRRGVVLKGGKPNPSVRTQLAAGRELRSWAAEFGLTPSSEGRLRVPEVRPDDNDFD